MLFVETHGHGVDGIQVGQWDCVFKLLPDEGLPVRMQLRDASTIGVLELFQTAVRGQVELGIELGEIRFHRMKICFRHPILPRVTLQPWSPVAV